MINVLLFAQLKAAAGKDRLEVEAEGLTVSGLKQKLGADFGLEGLDAVMTAVNEEFADDETVLKDGDTAAFIPPVSGG